MKKIIQFLATIICLLLVLGSCKKFLTTNPTSSFTDANYYRTPSDANTALTGCYTGLNLLYNTALAQAYAPLTFMVFPVLSQIASDECLGGMGTGDNPAYAQMINVFNPNVAPGVTLLFSPYWKIYYQSLNYCNLLISKLDQIDWNADNTITRAQCEGEARFIRAYIYFELVRLFEKVPLVTKPSTGGIVPQATTDEIYKQIIEDLKYGADNLPATSVTASPYVGHATKWGAEAMLSRVFLFYTGYYGKADCAGFTKAQALAACEDVISNSGHQLVNDFSKLWLPSAYENAVRANPNGSIDNYNTLLGTYYAGETGADGNLEVMFSIRYSYNGTFDVSQMSSNTFQVFWGIRNGGNNQSSYPFSQGWGFAPIDPKLVAVFNAQPNDKRYKASVLDATGDINYPADGHPDSREWTGYLIKKYTGICAKDESGNYTDIAVILGGTAFNFSQFQDLFILRYADVLLMAAELGSPKALDYFNQVHTRAGLPPVGSINTTPNNIGADGENDIMKERRLEFVGEAIRYWDIMRQNNGGDFSIPAHIIYNNTTQGDVLLNANLFSIDQIKRTRGFQQIPQDQITLSNGGLTQNQGW